ncbi:MAG: adenylosuccinate synthetase [Anaerolineae bacterium]|nr:adenylosuccinate synthetase [Anaerolineae bacterium]
MSDPFAALYHAVYEQGQLFGVDQPLTADPLRAVPNSVRPNSIAIGGGAFGDEGKGRVVDELCGILAQRTEQLVVYRWNGGANAGHTVIVDNQRLALHQIPSGALHKAAVGVLGKGMVIHPEDLLEESLQVAQVRGCAPHELAMYVDSNAVLALDTHRAFESALKTWESGGSGATGRGIAPAYADVLLRHPVRVRDLLADDWRVRLGKHYALYAALINGLGAQIETISVPSLRGMRPVGTQDDFLSRLEQPRAFLQAITVDGYQYLARRWTQPERYAFIFEGAQAVGLDPRFGVYPDVTASDPTFGGILSSTEGLIAPEQVAVRASTLKATYSSSVGTRRLPTHMPEPLATRIREDAHEYGATTRRPRDILYFDLPCLSYFARVSRATHLVLTHLDIAYPDVPIRVCTHYTDASGTPMPYRPDQHYLNGLTAHFRDLPSWNGAAMRGAKRLADLPHSALQYIAFITQALGATPLMATTGAQRDALISWLP